jgi:hypothetical protein
MRIRSRLLLTT